MSRQIFIYTDEEIDAMSVDEFDELFAKSPEMFKFYSPARDRKLEKPSTLKEMKDELIRGIFVRGDSEEIGAAMKKISDRYKQETAQAETDRLFKMMARSAEYMSKEEKKEFLRIVSEKTGVEFKPKENRKTNLEFLMELYASGDVERIARNRVWFEGEVGLLASFKGDFGSLTYYSIENDKEKMRERAIEKEIMWLKEYQI